MGYAGRKTALVAAVAVVATTAGPSNAPRLLGGSRRAFFSIG